MAPSEEDEMLKCKEALMLEATEHSLDLEWLEMREHQVTQV